MDKKPDMLFEVSWEICNKVGGIFTVVQSKAALIQEHYGNGYFMMGPYFHNKAQAEFQEQMPPEEFKQIFAELQQEGINCHFGKWLIKGTPNTILIECSDFASQKDNIKKELWEKFQIDSLGTTFYDFDEPTIWAYACGKLIEKAASAFQNKQIAMQAHEWLSGAAILYLKARKVRVGCVFTTHATMLGRTMSGHNIDIYNTLDQVDPDAEAKRFGIQSKYSTEKACAHNAEVFTTVSEITGLEAEKLLGKKPDVLLPNGLDMAKFPTFDELSIRHKILKQKIREFLMFYFFPYYSFNLSKTLIFFICARYEYHVKGADLLIKSLSMLNERLKKEKSDKTIVTFFWIPGNNRGVKPLMLENASYFKDIKDNVEESWDYIKNKIITSVVSKKKISTDLLFGDQFSELQLKLRRFQKEGLPPLNTHDLHDEESDPILNGFKAHGLTNKEEDRVKVVFYSTFLTGADGMLDTNYYESIIGSHLGIFPSIYEPWGYTPLEAAALGVASVTADLAGFGKFIDKIHPPGKFPGVYILKRHNKSFDESTKDLADYLYKYSHLSKPDRVKTKMQARNVAHLADWKTLIKQYYKAHNLAIHKVN